MESNRTRIIIVIGPPGSGKGTQSILLAKKLGLVHISTGDMCRDMVQSKTEMGKRLETYLSRGHFVPDSLMLEILQNRLRQQDAISRGVILDGFPRTAHQARALVSQPDIDIERFILLQASDEICTDRILGRRIDPVTGEAYHIKHLPPPGDQPFIGQRLIRRELDIDESIIRKRLETYHIQLGVLLQYFKGKIQVVNSNRRISEVEESFNRLMSEPAPVVPVLPHIEEKKKPKAAPREEQCVVCMNNPADYLVIPCGHQCGCDECLGELQRRNGGCPICRQPIQSLLKVFRAGIIDDDEDDERHTTDVDIYPQNSANESDGGWGDEAQKVAESSALHNLEQVISKQIKIDVAPCEEVAHNGGKVNVGITISIPDLQERIPVDICCVVDISGSMGEDAKFQDPNDEKKTISSGLSQLDIVKHAVKTVIHTLTDQDRLSIVAFDSHASIVFSLSEMNEGGRKQAWTALEKLHQDGNTDIWAGLIAGLDSLREPKTEIFSGLPRKKSIILLTDGQPNRSPPQGEERALHDYFEKYPNFHCQVNTFGFGYSLNSKLLQDIAIRGRGTFSFIPDAKIVGTCFVSAIANACSTMSQNCKVHLLLKNSSAFVGNPAVGGNYIVAETTWGKVVDIGPLHYGQSRDLIVSMDLPATDLYSNPLPYLEVVVEYDNATGEGSHKIQELCSSRQPTLNSITALIRNQIVSSLHNIINECEKGNGPNGVREMKALVGKVAAYEAESKNSGNSDGRLTGLNEDVSGRMSKAISTVERFKRWGKHYLRAITRAHQLQMRTNFMDPGLQIYGGSLFKKLEDEGGKIFITLTMHKQPKKPPVAQPAQRYQQAQVPAPVVQTYVPPPPPDNSTYYGGSGGGCFDISCSVMKYDTPSQYRSDPFISVPMNLLKQGDFVKVKTIDGEESTSKVECVVIIKRKIASPLVEFKSSGLKITKNHPIRINDQWCLPKDKITGDDISFVESSEDVYNLVLDKKCVLLVVNGMECVTFGHGYEGDIVYDDFYGTEKVIDTISSLPGWDNGLVTVHGSLRSLSNI